MTFEFTTLLGGLGLFLLGMTMLSDGLKLAAGTALETILSKATKTRWHGLTSGALTTAMVQSSSAVTVATIGFVNAGLLSLGSGMWVLFGANVGTTVTAVVAVIGATPNAKRAATAHVLFNIVIAIFGFSLLYWMVPAIETLRSFWGLGDSAATTLALFNTMLNIAGVVVMWPVADRMATELLKRFKPLPSAAAQPQFLDKKTLGD